MLLAILIRNLAPRCETSRVSRLAPACASRVSRDVSRGSRGFPSYRLATINYCIMPLIVMMLELYLENKETQKKINLYDNTHTRDLLARQAGRKYVIIRA